MQRLGDAVDTYEDALESNGDWLDAARYAIDKIADEYRAIERRAKEEQHAQY